MKMMRAFIKEHKENLKREAERNKEAINTLNLNLEALVLIRKLHIVFRLKETMDSCD